MTQDGNSDFHGAKLALFIGAALVVIRRDDRPDIPWPGALDLPGGGREGDESPAACVLRETREELGLILTEADLTWRRFYGTADVPVWFFTGRIAATREADIRFGSEGQGWQMMSPANFLAHPEAVPHFQTRLRDFYAATGQTLPGA